jgi:hypothetical protein
MKRDESDLRICFAGRNEPVAGLEQSQIIVQRRGGPLFHDRNTTLFLPNLNREIRGEGAGFRQRAQIIVASTLDMRYDAIVFVQKT